VAARPDLILAIETATRVVGVALLRGEEPLLELARDARTQSEALLPAIDEALRRAGVYSTT
jgi:tRNA A37 threonylcarbamoyladenosine modification protein TsaB